MLGGSEKECMRIYRPKVPLLAIFRRQDKISFQGIEFIWPSHRNCWNSGNGGGLVG